MRGVDPDMAHLALLLSSVDLFLPRLEERCASVLGCLNLAALARLHLFRFPFRLGCIIRACSQPGKP